MCLYVVCYYLADTLKTGPLLVPSIIKSTDTIFAATFFNIFEITDFIKSYLSRKTRANGDKTGCILKTCITNQVCDQFDS